MQILLIIYNFTCTILVQPAPFRGTLTQEQWLCWKTASSRNLQGREPRKINIILALCRGSPLVELNQNQNFEPINSICTWTKKTVQQVNAFVTAPDSQCLYPKPLMAEEEPTASSLLISTCVSWAHACNGRCVHAHTHTI